MDEENYEPDEIDIEFTNAVIHTVKNGGMWVLPTTKLIYTLHHDVKVMVLTNPDRLEEGDCRVIHNRAKIVWRKVGWEVLP